MLKHWFNLKVGFSLALLLALGSSGRADDEVLEELYGKGVHDYFAGRYREAIQNLSSAASSGSKDPRVYYFRAMANLRNGNSKQATADMKRGAALETADANDQYPVSKSLERIQGSQRLTLERYRSTARAQRLNREDARDVVRIEQQRRAEQEVLRQPAPGTASQAAAIADQEPAAGQPAAEPIVDKAAAQPDPFAEPPAANVNAAKKPIAKAATATPAEADPFADGDKTPAEAEPKVAEAKAGGDAAPAEKPAAAGDDPFSEPPAPKGVAADQPPAAAPPPAPADEGGAAQSGAKAPGGGIFGALGKAGSSAARGLFPSLGGIGKAMEKAAKGAGVPLPPGAVPGFGPGGPPDDMKRAAPLPGNPPANNGVATPASAAPKGGDPFGDDPNQSTPPAKAAPAPKPAPKAPAAKDDNPFDDK